MHAPSMEGVPVIVRAFEPQLPDPWRPGASFPAA